LQETRHKTAFSDVRWWRDSPHEFCTMRGTPHPPGGGNTFFKTYLLCLMGISPFLAIMAFGVVMDAVTAELFEETIYSRLVLTVDDMVYGPFARSDPARCSNVVPGGCLVNYGATSIAVWSLSRSIGPLVPPPSLFLVLFRCCSCLFSFSGVRGSVGGVYWWRQVQCHNRCLLICYRFVL
ncbi:hypothetical protein DQ04_13081000, partial [Trypanosoma grayi]|uniref:hypothetical protein n=1 Tax=Trypanosoma grayi TaxID=71804 RepID=UPI0004F4010A